VTFKTSLERGSQNSRWRRDQERDRARLDQDQIRRAERHARASRIRVRLATNQDHLSLEVSDDGIGFDLECSTQPGRLGLIGVRERLNEVGGELRLGTSTLGCALAVAEIPTSWAFDDD